MPAIAISAFNPSQASAVGRLISSIQQNEFEIPITLEQQPDLADIPGFYQKGNGNFWVATFGDEVVGTLALLDIGDNRAALRKMFVSPEYRGGAYSTAKLLLNELFSWSQERRLHEIYLGTTSKFLAAHRFYEKNGFIEIPKETLPASFPIMTVDTKFYKIRVA